MVEAVRSQLLALRQPLMHRAQQQQQQQQQQPPPPQQAAVQLPVEKRASPLLAPAETLPQPPPLPPGQELSPGQQLVQHTSSFTSAQASPFAQPPAALQDEI